MLVLGVKASLCLRVLEDESCQGTGANDVEKHANGPAANFGCAKPVAYLAELK